MRNLFALIALAFAATLAVTQVGRAASDPIVVNVYNFARAQADMELALTDGLPSIAEGRALR